MHLLVNNAGISGPSSSTEASSVSGIKEDLFNGIEFHEWDDTYRLNVAAVYFVTMAFWPLLKKASEAERGFSASVINISSISGITKESQNHFCYNSSKAATIHLTRMLARHLVPPSPYLFAQFLCCNLMVDGVQNPSQFNCSGDFPYALCWVELTVASEMTTDKDASDDKNQSTLEGQDSMPAKRAGNVVDMGRVALFLGSRGSEYLNGQIVAVDGGFLLEFPSAG